MVKKYVYLLASIGCLLLILGIAKFYSSRQGIECLVVAENDLTNI